MRYIGFLLIFFIFSACQSGNKNESNKGNSLPLKASVQINSTVLDSVQKILSKYDALKDAFVEADSIAILNAATILSARLHHFNSDEISDSILLEKVNQSISSMHDQMDKLIAEKDLTLKRRSFAGISDTLYFLLKNIQFSGKSVYLQKCPMAFNDSEEAHWLSPNSDIINPYLGKKHPRYGAGMLACGENLDSLNFSR